MNKNFIRFICNTKDHPRGEKIKALNIITKIYDKDNNFLYVRKPYIHASENQIEIDIEGTDYKPYLPLHHFKADNGKIIKKSEQEIQTFEAEVAQIKEQRRIEWEQKVQKRQDNENIIADVTKTDKERLDALIQLYKGV